MKNTCPFYIIFKVLKVLLIKICKIEPPDLLFIVVFISFYISFISADIIFHKFLELHSTLSGKKILVTNFLFLTDSLPRYPSPTPPHLFKSQNPLSVTKVFCRCSLIRFVTNNSVIPKVIVSEMGAKKAAK